MTTEEKQLVLEFLGFNLINYKGHLTVNGNRNYSTIGECTDHFGQYFDPTGSKVSAMKNYFSKEWSLLMILIRQIEQIEGVYDMEEFLLIRDELITCRIDTTYRAVIEFIEYYNQQ